AQIVDFIGYGTTPNCNETANAPAPSVTLADTRAGSGCTDTDNNSTDFSALAPNPRNSATDAAPCGASLPNLTIHHVSLAEGNGDTAVEPNETFFVNVTNVTGATVTDGQGQGTIQNDDSPPNLTVNDVAHNEGNSGTTSYAFTVSLSAPAPVGGVTFDIATAD